MSILRANLRLRDEPSSPHSATSSGHSRLLPILPENLHAKQHSSASRSARASKSARKDSNKVQSYARDAGPDSQHRSCCCVDRRASRSVAWFYAEWQQHQSGVPSTLNQKTILQRAFSVLKSQFDFDYYYYYDIKKIVNWVVKVCFSCLCLYKSPILLIMSLCSWVDRWLNP